MAKIGRVVIIIQARMGSTRLPGKVLMRVFDKPLLGYLIERLSRVKLVDEIVIATTKNSPDDAIEEFCINNNINCYRGSEDNVLSRYYNASIKFKADCIVRICSDSPLIDPLVVDRMIQSFFNNECDYLSNTISQTYPLGMNIEVFSQQALKKSYMNYSEDYESEHVTPYIYMHPEFFDIRQEHLREDYGFLRLTVDEEKDFILVKRIIERLYPLNRSFGLDDIIKEYKKDPDLFLINSGIAQKKLINS
jgi:spore coat polysaccharide biosynthesis protein SpsF